MKSLGLRIGVIAVIVIAGVILRPFISGNASDLSVGDCFDLPTSTATEVKDVQHHPCDQDHGGEVIWVGNYPGTKSDPYPTDPEMFAFVSSQCIPVYNTYTGKDLTTQLEWDVNWLQPTEDGWKKGDLKVTCFLFRVDNTKFKGSQKAAG